MPATDFEGVINILKHDLVPVIFGLHATHFGQADQGITMDAMESIGEFLFEIFKRVFDQHLALCVANCDVFLIGDKIIKNL